MSALGFEVHMDKENATPAPSVGKRGPLKSFASKGKLFQPTPRKALFDVNQELSNVTTLRTHGKSEFGSAGSKGGLLSSQKASVKISNGVENIPVGGHGKVQDSKKTSVIKEKGFKVLKDTEMCPPKCKPATEPKMTEALPKPKPEAEVSEEDYDSDSIFPRSERLSTYADRLLGWRFPCLLGHVPDNESDNSDIEELPLSNFLLDVPPFVPLVPEFSDADLSDLMENLPPPIPESEDCERIA